MDRRRFTAALATGLALPFTTSAAPAPRRPLLPARLKRGDTVGLITPASFIDDDSLQRAYQQIEGLGLTVKPGRYLRSEHGFLAGSDRERLDDLHAMFADRDVKAVWCARGGYGSARLLPALNYDLIRRNPKILIGYSDITALLNAITNQTGLVTYHGPVGSSEFTPYTERHMRNALLEGEAWQRIELPDGATEQYIIHPGIATGSLWGGNLSLLAAMVGTKAVPDLEGKVLFIEEVGEKPYRVDRMLTQLRQAWQLQRCAGIMLGLFHDCEADAGDRSLTLRETLTDRLGDLGIPVAYGLPIGHIKDMCTLPVGGTVRFSALDFYIEPSV
ncbi:S66 peptidase family protein [Neolewinella xylanilytica]|nr:LD-carboxypeptidase [Neolewinella xylanilytica]